MVVLFNCKQWIVQPYFEWKISNGRIANVLVEGLKFSKKKKNCLDKRFQLQGLRNSILSAWKQWPLHARSIEYHWSTNENRQRDYIHLTGESAK